MRRPDLGPLKSPVWPAWAMSILFLLTADHKTQGHIVIVSWMLLMAGAFVYWVRVEVLPMLRWMLRGDEEKSPRE